MDAREATIAHLVELGFLAAQEGKRLPDAVAAVLASDRPRERPEVHREASGQLVVVEVRKS